MSRSSSQLISFSFSFDKISQELPDFICHLNRIVLQVQLDLTFLCSLVAVSKQDMEKLRQALKTLSEAEKQLRMSNDRLTWLTAALLQLAPDQQYMLPNSSADTSFIQSPLGLNNAGGTERPRKSNVEHADLPHKDTKGRVENFQAGSSGDIYSDSRMKGVCIGGKGHNGAGVFAQKAYSVSSDKNRMSSGQLPDKLHHDIEEIWLEVLQNIEINGLKEFMYREGKLTSLSFGAGTIRLGLLQISLAMSCGHD